MRYIAVPPPVEIVLARVCQACRRPFEGGPHREMMSLRQFVIDSPLMDPKAVRDAESIARMIKLKGVFAEPETPSVPDVIAVEDADYQYLVQLVKAPSAGYNPQIVEAIMPLLTALGVYDDKLVPTKPPKAPEPPPAEPAAA